MTRRREYRIAYAPEPIFEAKPRLRYKQLCRSLTFTTITFRPSRIYRFHSRLKIVQCVTRSGGDPRVEALVQKNTDGK
jgi:hypothetical protein